MNAAAPITQPSLALSGPYRITIIDTHPKPVVRSSIASAREAQLYALFLANRFPRRKFAYETDPGGDVARFAPAMMIRAAATQQMQADVEHALAKEAEANPDRHEQWLLFLYRNGPNRRPQFQMSLYLAHDAEVVGRCYADPSLAQVVLIYSDNPHEAALATFDAWSKKQ